MIAILLVFEAVMILTAIAVACSTRLGWVMTLLICIGISWLGLITESWLGDFVRNPDFATYEWPFGHVLWGLSKTVYVITPNFQSLWPADDLLNRYWENDTGMVLKYLLTVSGYGLLQIAAFLFLGVGLFQTREVG